jgi:hypothetical protein
MANDYLGLDYLNEEKEPKYKQNFHRNMEYIYLKDEENKEE